jgi:hypothetical protein
MHPSEDGDILRPKAGTEERAAFIAVDSILA